MSERPLPQPLVPPAPRAKGKTSTFAIVLAVLGGMFLLLVVALGIGMYVFFTSPTGKEVAGVVGEAMKVSQKAQKAPGTNELRAAGCKQALVMTSADLDKITGHADGAAPPRDAPFGEIVMCNVGPWSTPPSCDELARTYTRAVGPRGEPFAVTSQKAGQSKPSCTVVYSALGERSVDFDAKPPAGWSPPPSLSGGDEPGGDEREEEPPAGE